MQYRVVNADGHTIEPPDMWERYMPSRFKDKLPSLVKDPKGGDAWELYRGVAPMPIGMVATPGQRYEEFDWFGHSYDSVLATPPSAPKTIRSGPRPRRCRCPYTSTA